MDDEDKQALQEDIDVDELAHKILALLASQAGWGSGEGDEGGG